MSETFAAWDLGELLGHNGLGPTHAATHRETKVRGVLKQFSGEAPEVALAATLSHPGLARVLDSGKGFVVYEDVEGASLAELIRAAQETKQWPLPMFRAVALIRPILEGLAAAHALAPPLLHRELLPENVRVTPEGRVVLTDLGLGKLRLRAGDSSGMRRAYVSPEQARGNAVDVRSELFTAGLLLFELVCGRLPAQGGAAEVITRIATGDLDAPLAVNPNLDDEAAALVQRALAQRPEDRFASARDLSDALSVWKDDAALGPWAAQLAQVSLPPSPPPLAAPLVVVPVAIEPAAAAAPVAVSKAPPAKRSRLMVAAALGLIAAPIAWRAYEARTVEVTQTIPTRSMEVASSPSGAQVWVDGELQDRRTPMTLQVPKNELRNLVIKKAGYGTWSSTVSNTRALEVSLVTGGLTREDRYEGARPSQNSPLAKPPPMPADDDPVDPDAPPKDEVVFDAETAPIDVVLTPAHSIKADGQPTETVGADTVVNGVSPTVIYARPSTPAVGRSQTTRQATPKSMTWNYASTNNTISRLATVFALKRGSNPVTVVDLSKATTLSAGTWTLFSPTEGGDLTVQMSTLRLNDAQVVLNARNLLRVDHDDSFLVRVLQPRQVYRVEVKPVNGGTLPAVLMSLGAPGRQAELRFDGEEIPTGQLLLPAGSHTFTGASNVWFTILTADGVVTPSVRLTLKPVSSTKLR